MAPRPIYIKRYFVNLLLAKNLQLYLEHRQQHGIWTATHPSRYSIQFDPMTGHYEQALFSGTELKHIDVKPEWKVFILPVPTGEYELNAMKEAISSGANPLMSGNNDYYGIIVD